MARASDITEAQVRREQHVEPDLTDAEAADQRLDHLEQVKAGFVDQQTLLGRVGAPLEPQEQQMLAEAAADVMKPQLPIEGELDLAALLGTMLLKHGYTNEAQVTGLVEAMKTNGKTPYRPGDDNSPIQLSPEEERERAALVAAKAQMRMTTLAITSDKQRNVLAMLDVPRSMLVPLDIHEQIEMIRNGVSIKLGKGRHMVAPYVLSEFQYRESKKSEETIRIATEQRRVDITEEVYRQKRGFEQEVWTGYSYSIAKGG